MSENIGMQIIMLYLNREYCRAEYDKAFRVCNVCFPNERFKYEAGNPDSFRLLVTQLLPVLKMRADGVSRKNWWDRQTPTGKHWIEFRRRQVKGPKFRSIGYHLAYENSLCGIALTWGMPSQVVKIGLGIKQVKVEPKGTPVKVYLECFSQMLTRVEMANIKENPDDIILKRLCILLALKEAYIKASGEPLGFDCTRLEFDVPNQRVILNEYPLIGWEFRVFVSQLGVARGDVLKHEEYICVCAFYRGSLESTCIFEESTEELDKWIQYITLEQLMNSADKLTD